MLKRLMETAGGAVLALAGVTIGFSQAMAVEGHAVPGQMNLPVPATPVMHDIVAFHDFVNPIIILIAIFVLALLVYVVFRFRESANPNPSTTTHNTILEVAWTVIPILILVAISIPSFKLLHFQYSYPPADLTIKAIGNTWYWTHEYPGASDNDKGFSFDSIMLSDEDRKPLVDKGIDAPRLLAVDNPVVVPAGKVVHVLVTSNDVIHNWTVQPFGSKIDAVPGRITSTWFRADKEGMFYGQCSELCGKDHAFMPIAVRVVKEETFNTWHAAMKAKDKKKAKQILDEVALEEAGRRKVAAN